MVTDFAYFSNIKDDIADPSVVLNLENMLRSTPTPTRKNVQMNDEVARAMEKINDKVADAMEKTHSTSELISHWSGLEEVVFEYIANNADDPSGTVPLVRRAQALKFMSDILRAMGQEEVRGHACVLLDALCVKQGVQATFTPQNVVAAALVAAKFSGLMSVRQLFHEIAKLVTEVFECPQTACVDMLRRAELTLLSGLTWRVAIPSIDSWSMTILARIASLTGDFVQGTAFVRMAQPPVAKWCEHFMFHVQASAECPPRILALGAVTMGLVSRGLLACEGFLPLNTPLQVWHAALDATLVSKVDLPVSQEDIGKVQEISMETLAEAVQSTVCGLEADIVVALQMLSTTAQWYQKMYQMQLMYDGQMQY